MLGTASELYLYGTQYMLIGIAYIFVVGLAAHFFLPVFYNLGTTSAYQVREFCKFSIGVKHVIISFE